MKLFSDFHSRQKFFGLTVHVFAEKAVTLWRKRIHDSYHFMSNFQNTEVI